MSVVIFFDRKTGEILAVDEHPEWGEREVRMSYYRAHPEKRPKGTGVLTVPPDIRWDGIKENWVVAIDNRGLPRLKRREDFEIEREIELAKEKALLQLSKQHLSSRARERAEEILGKLEGRLSKT